MKNTLNKKEIIDLLPHREPMLLIEELINLSGDSAYLHEYRNKDIQYTQFPKALEEFNKQKIPFIIRRGLSYSNSYEYWKLKDMII